MSTSRRHLSTGRGRPVGPEALALSLLAKRYCLETFMAEPVVLQQGSTSLPGGTDAVRNILDTGFNRFEYTQVGGASDLFVPVLGSEGGYDFKFDHDTAAEGVNLNFGGTLKGHPRSYRPGSENFFVRLLLNVADASGVNLFFALQDIGAIAAGYTDWTNVVGVRILGDSSSTTALVRAESNIGNTGSTDTVTSDLGVTLEEPTEIEVEIQVVGKVARVLVNGAQRSTGSLTMTFTGSPTVTPSAALLQSTDTSATVKLLAFECGLLEDRYEGATLRTLLTAMGVQAST